VLSEVCCVVFVRCKRYVFKYVFNPLLPSVTINVWEIFQI
jgi:hypothetical protein